MIKKEKKTYPKFSVLMSVYKRENPQFLDQSLDSIENQTVIPTEIIMVEDGPISKELDNIISRHRNNFVNDFKMIKSIRNQGLGASLQLGTEFVSTNWIARMDSDDISVSNRFELQLNEIMKKPDLAVIGGQIQEFSGDVKNIVGHRKVPTKNELLRQFVKWRNPFNHPTVLVNKKALNAVGGYMPYGNLEDYYLWSRIIAHNYLVENINDFIVYMRVDDGMYRRRGKIGNIIYFYKLRHFMYKKSLVTHFEAIIGDLLMTTNIIMPNCLRSFIYKKFLHKK